MTLIALAMALAVASAVVYRRHGVSGVSDGLALGAGMLRQVLPLMLLGMVLAGFTRVALPEDLISRWLGEDAGVTSVLLGAAAGALLPAGPYVMMPLLGSLLGAGAGVGPIAAFMTAWSIIPISRTLVWEIPFLGGAFAASRTLVSLPFPFASGFAVPYVIKLFE